MKMYLKCGHEWKRVENPRTGASSVFGSYRRILSSGIERTSRCRYKVYVIATWGIVGGALFHGIGEAVSYLQGIYDGENPA